MSTTTSKIAITVVVIFVIAAGALALQVYVPRFGGQNVTKQQMEAFVASLPPQQQAQLANDEQRKGFAKTVKELLAVGQEAVKQGYETKDPKTVLSLDLVEKQVLADEYQNDQQKKNQSPQISDEDRKKWEAANANSFDNFLVGYSKANPGADQIPPDQREEFKKQYEDIMIMGERAKAARLDQDPGFQLNLRISKAQVLARQYATDLNKNITVSKEDEQKYYDAHKADYEQVHARHILISTQPKATPDNGGKATPVDKDAAKKKAEGLLAQARSGKDFAELAKENTEDPSGKDNGGDLGYFTRGKMVKEFENAAFSLQPGQISDIVESSFGYHIIKVEDHRQAPLEDVQADIDQKLKADKFKDTIDQIVKKSSIQVPDDFKVSPAAGGIQALPGGGVPAGHP